jgi:hypothetical protein
MHLHWKWRELIAPEEVVYAKNQNMFMREIVKLRMVAGSIVVSLPHSILEPVGLSAGTG